MGLAERRTLFFKIKTSAALAQLEDPREVLDYAYGEQQLHLRTVRRGLVEVAATRRQLEQEAERLRARDTAGGPGSPRTPTQSRRPGPSGPRAQAGGAHRDRAPLYHANSFQATQPLSQERARDTRQTAFEFVEVMAAGQELA